jgi:hypothetical protein
MVPIPVPWNPHVFASVNSSCGCGLSKQLLFVKRAVMVLAKALVLIAVSE